MKILLTAKDGQVGFALHKKLASLGEVIATNRDTLDLSDPQAIRAFIDKTKPDIIINPAAYTKVDQAENEPELASQINAAAPQVLTDKASEFDRSSSCRPVASTSPKDNNFLCNANPT